MFTKDITKFSIYKHNILAGVSKHSTQNLITSISQLDYAILCEIPKFLLIIEFDHLKNKKSYIYDFARSEAEKNIKAIEEYLIRNEIYYIITDHHAFKTSKSPHLYIPLDFEKYPRDLVLIYELKKYIYRKILSECELSYHYVANDLGFLSSTKTFPVPGSQHFKPEHNRAIQEIIKEGAGNPLKVSVKDFQQLQHIINLNESYDHAVQKLQDRYFKKYTSNYDLNLDVDKLVKMFHKEFVAGQHNYAAMSISCFMAYWKVPISFTNIIFTRLIELEGVSAEINKYFEIIKDSYKQEHCAYKHWLGFLGYDKETIDEIVHTWKEVLLKRK